MKFSISVPDELWESARTIIPGDSPSAVVQEALRRLVSEHAGGPSYAETPALEDELAAALGATSERLLTEARDLYQVGYRRGVKLAAELNWAQLSTIAGIGVVAAAKAIAEQERFHNRTGNELPPGARPWIEAGLLAEYVGSHADDAMNWAPSPVTLEGMDRALRDVWEHVRTPVGAPTQRTQQCAPQ